MAKINDNYSVLMPVKNGSKFILYSLKSVVEQTCSATNIIVIDDHSTDLTRKLVETNFPAVRVIQASGNGQLNAIFEGLQTVDTEYVSFLDSDDYWSPIKQETQLRTLLTNQELDAVCSGVVNFLNNEDDATDLSGNAKSFTHSRQFGATTFRTKSLQNSFPLMSNMSHFQWQMDWWIKSIDQGLKYSQTNELHLYRRIHKHNSWSTMSVQGNRELIEFIRIHKERR
jgi:glycosyltransferase involved in cell wall biosynthesis